MTYNLAAVAAVVAVVAVVDVVDVIVVVALVIVCQFVLPFVVRNVRRKRSR